MIFFLLPLQPEFYMKLKSLTKVERGPPKGQSCEFGEILQSGLGDVIYVSMDGHTDHRTSKGHKSLP